MQAQPMARQHLADRVLMIAAAGRTPAALDHIFGNDGRARKDDIFNHALATDAGTSERSAAIRAGIARWYHLGVVNPGGTAATGALVANCATAPFGWRGVVGTRSCAEGFALEID